MPRQDRHCGPKIAIRSAKRHHGEQRRKKEEGRREDRPGVHHGTAHRKAKAARAKLLAVTSLAKGLSVVLGEGGAVETLLALEAREAVLVPVSSGTAGPLCRATNHQSVNQSVNRSVALILSFALCAARARETRRGGKRRGRPQAPRTRKVDGLLATWTLD